VPIPGYHVFNSDPKNKAAIVFVHGFTGDLIGTWRKIPDLIRQDGHLKGWDLVAFGYSSTRRFDIPGLWSADGDLEAIASTLYSRPELSSSGKYDRLAFVAHSMGGLVVQQSIVSHKDLRDRVSHVILFGTPSNGLKKAGFFDRWKRQINNMREGGPFITALREAWTQQGLNTSTFKVLVVRGENDEFVPKTSSIECFPESLRGSIPGDHLTMLEGDTVDAPAVQTIIQAITGGRHQLKGTASSAAWEIERARFRKIVNDAWPEYLTNANAAFPVLDDSGAGKLAKALEKLGDADTAIRFLMEHKAEGTDVIGILAGTVKRRWWLHSRKEDLDLAVGCYTRAYRQATQDPVNHDQAYYHGTNIAYLTLAKKEIPKAREWADKVLTHTPNAIDEQNRKWILPTEADALMIRGDIASGLEKHKLAASQEMLPWEAVSMEQQAIRVADLCGVPEAKIQELSGWYESRV